MPEIPSSSETLISRFERILPPYLTAANKVKLSHQISKFPHERDYFAYSWEGPKQPIQGDGWSGFSKLDFNTARKLTVSGVVLSNSCDIDENNRSIRDRNVVFAPIIPIKSYENRLKTAPTVNEEKIAAHLEAVRNQAKTEIFYLPESRATPEAVVLFDDVAAQPLGSFTLQRGRRRLFRLNNYGFYIFLMKLSIHFTRFGEALDRDAPNTT